MSATPIEVVRTTDEARIRQLMLDNLFAVFNERDPDRPAASAGVSVRPVAARVRRVF